MTTKDIIKEMEKQFDEKFKKAGHTIYADELGVIVSSQDVMRDFVFGSIRTLLESFGEEILEGLVAKGLIREADTTTRVEVGWRFEDSHGYCADELVESIRLKVKEIINSLEK